jgi:hypothetical protein
MQQEYSSIMDNGTWELVDLPNDRVVVNIMWIYKVKSGAVSDVSRFKARFVAKGCSQRAGLAYTETFSPVIRMASLRLFLAIAAARDLELRQLDIDTAFLYAPIKEDVYIRQPLGFVDGTSKGVSSQALPLRTSTVPSRVQHATSCMPCRPRVETMQLRPLHLYLPRRSRLRHNRS